MPSAPKGLRLRRTSLLSTGAASTAAAFLVFLCLLLALRCRRCGALDVCVAAGRLAGPGLLPEDAADEGRRQGPGWQTPRRRRRERLAVLVPYRDRPAHLARMLPVTAACLAASGADASILVLEQAPGLHFNRGALLNAGALLLAGSEYDCMVFHDVDTVCGPRDTVWSSSHLGPCRLLRL